LQTVSEAVNLLYEAIDKVYAMEDFGGVEIEIFDKTRYAAHEYLKNYSRDDSDFDEEYN
jgi:hypothetical protein